MEKLSWLILQSARWFTGAGWSSKWQNCTLSSVWDFAGTCCLICISAYGCFDSILLMCTSVLYIDHHFVQQFFLFLFWWLMNQINPQEPNMDPIELKLGESYEPLRRIMCSSWEKKIVASCGTKIILIDTSKGVAVEKIVTTDENRWDATS